MSDIQQIPLVPEHTAILRKCQYAFCYAVKAKFNCMAILHNMEEAGTFGSNSGVLRAEKRYSTKLSSGVEISIWKDDLTRHQVDAVVNAANEKLNHAGGLAQALSDIGGPMIQKWSDDIIQQVQRVKTGDAVLTLAGNLPCKYIIHAVGPCLSPNPTKKDIDRAIPFLHNAILRILEIVVINNISSVAIPALSSGLFHFPRGLCADIIVKAIKQFHDLNGFPGKNLEIHLVNNDEPSVHEMERATRAVFDPSSTSGSYSVAVQGGNQSKTFSSSKSLQFGNVTLHLKKGFIEEEKVDVIVNTIAKDCDLSRGEVSKAILNKAGRKIQDEINRQRYSGKGYTGADLYETKGYDLKCRAVFHTVCAFRSDPNAEKILFKGVSECLRKAALNHTSISFPAIGTGNLGLDKYQVARIMMDAVAGFAKQSLKLNIYFVVFPKDEEMMKAFEKEMKRRKEGTMSPVLPSDMTTSFAFAAKETTANETPNVEFHSVSKEAEREAKAWTFNMLKQADNMTIRNNHVIYLDQRDHENLLSLQAMFRVHIKEFFRNGNGGITITGSPSDVSCAAIEVESMLCKAQQDFAEAEERDILYSVVRWSCKDEPWIQTPETSAVLEKAYLAGSEEITFSNHKFKFKSMVLIDNSGGLSSMKRTCLLDPFKPLNNSFYARIPVSEEYVDKEGRRALEDFGLRVVKVEKLENIALQQLFNKNEQRVKDKPKHLYQRVSAQFCDLICRVGFQKEFAPPAEQKYGSGIYFSSTVDGAMKLWKEQDHEQYIYIIQARVLTGKSTDGSRDFVLPPALMGDPLNRYDSVFDRGQTHIIFSGQQALPECLIICDKSFAEQQYEHITNY
ncbi:protein mono-ADP-ribosyltransferase PARP9 isoform X1 [Megalobrama amblycephala]|uniref:protein mono-ADP-ribosyltransferase PARP9 isoform X1 n=1 Tax=Megalobrama amblycephala TaxID=75352 RepID=UPI002013D423|nr:protein mono-ADP-ribosyltransferase PARP9 isoform X1 [Megalobrama amblycephala]